MEPTTFTKGSPLDITCVYPSLDPPSMDIFREGSTNGQEDILMAMFKDSEPVYVASPGEQEATVTLRGGSTVLTLRILQAACSDVGVYSCTGRDGRGTSLRYGPEIDGKFDFYLLFLCRIVHCCLRCECVESWCPYTGRDGLRSNCVRS